MPTYEYECHQCGHRFERMQNLTDAPLEECPRCSGSVQRLISGGAGFILKKNEGACAHHEPGHPACGQDIPCCGRDEPCGKHFGED